MKTKNKINNRVTIAIEILNAAKQAFGEITGCNIQILKAVFEGRSSDHTPVQLDLMRS
jgi:hypothetical protein